MKGFTHTGKKQTSGFKYPTSFGFSSSSGKVQTVKSFTRRAPIRGIMKKAVGGQVPGMKKTPSSPANLVYDGDATSIGDQGNSAELRTKPLTEFDKDHGGRGPLRPGFALGGGVGMAPPMRAALGAQTARPMMRTAIPRGPMGRRPLMRAGGGKVPPKAPPPKAPPPPPKSEGVLKDLFNKSKNAEAEAGA